MLETVDPRTAVLEEVNALLAEAEHGPAEISGEDRLVDLGLTSLLLARLVLSLDLTLGVDPFAADAAVVDIRSVDDLVEAYERALIATTGRENDDQPDGRRGR